MFASLIAECFQVLGEDKVLAGLRGDASRESENAHTWDKEHEDVRGKSDVYTVAKVGAVNHDDAHDAHLAVRNHAVKTHGGDEEKWPGHVRKAVARHDSRAEKHRKAALGHRNRISDLAPD